MEIYQCEGRLHAIDAAEAIDVNQSDVQRVAVRPQDRPAIRFNTH